MLLRSYWMFCILNFAWYIYIYIYHIHIGLVMLSLTNFCSRNTFEVFELKPLTLMKCIYANPYWNLLKVEYFACESITGNNFITCWAVMYTPWCTKRVIFKVPKIACLFLRLLQKWFGSRNPICIVLLFTYSLNIHSLFSL